MRKRPPKPKVFVSKCLGFAACRWDGVKVSDDFVESIKDIVTFVTACPETEIGLGIPRDRIRIIGRGKKKRLIQLNTQRDVTKDMQEYVSGLIGSLGDDIDGFILKSRSPSCGIKDVKAYPDLKSEKISGNTSGFFASEVLRRFPKLPVETEARLSSHKVRENFITRLFTTAAIRARRNKKRRTAK